MVVENLRLSRSTALTCGSLFCAPPSSCFLFCFGATFLDWNTNDFRIAHAREVFAFSRYLLPQSPGEFYRQYRRTADSVVPSTKCAIREECYSKLISGRVCGRPSPSTVPCSLAFTSQPWQSEPSPPEFRQLSGQPSDWKCRASKSGAMRGIGYLDALASIFGERPKHLRKGLRLDRMLESSGSSRRPNR